MRYPRLITAFAVVALCALAVAYANRVPAVVPAEAPPEVFSAERAMVHVTEIARRPHPIGSAENARVREYLLARLTTLGLQPQVQEATGVSTRFPVSGRVRNVVVRVPGSPPGGLGVLLVAHYDGVPAGPAASDDGSGTAVLLETLRALRAGVALRHDVIALFADGEEAGLVGAAAFAREHSWAKDAGVIMNFDARGTRGPSLMFETGAGNLDVVRVLSDVRGVRATSLSTTVYRRLPNDTDLSELAVLGRPALNFAFIGGVPRYHTSEDDVSHLSRGSVQHHGNQALALARAFGDAPLPRPTTTDAVFFDVPLFGLVVYPESWALPPALLMLALVIGAAATLRHRDTNWIRGVSLGALAMLGSTVVCGMIGVGVGAALQALHAALPRGGAPAWSWLYAVAVALLSVAVVSACYALVRRFASAWAACVGALLVLALASVFIAARMPGFSFLFTWPLLLPAVAAIVSLRQSRPRASRVMMWGSAIVVIFLLVPTVYLMVCVALGLYATGAAVLGAFTAIGTWLLAPQMELVAGENPWRAPLVAAIAGVAVVAAGVATVRTDARHPAGVALVYAVDSDSLTGWFTGTASTAGARRWLENALGSSIPQSPPFRPPAWLARSYPVRRIVPAPVGAVTPPTATLVSDSTGANGSRIVTLRIVPDSGTRSIDMDAAPGMVLNAAVDGRTVSTTRYRRQSESWGLEYFAPPDSGFTLRLELRPGASGELTLLGRRAGIPTLQGIRPPSRPPGLIPIQSGDMTIVFRRVRL
ncbi:MAG: M28 family peptidase [Gemmatimonadaceae bacterium]